MELIFDILIEVYLELMFLIIPKKSASKKHLLLAKIFAILALLIIIGLALWGFILIVDQDNILGVIPLGAAAALSLAQIIAGIVLNTKKH